MTNTLEKALIQGALLTLAFASLNGCSYAPTHEESKEAAVGDMIQGTSPIDRAMTLTKLMVSTLGLSELQRAKVSGLNLDYSTRFNILMNSENPNIDKKQEFLRLSKEKENKLLSLLNDKQKRTYQSNRDELINTYRIM